MQKLAASCMLIEAVGEGIKKIDNITKGEHIKIAQVYHKSQITVFSGARVWRELKFYYYIYNYIYNSNCFRKEISFE